MSNKFLNADMIAKIINMIKKTGLLFNLSSKNFPISKPKKILTNIFRPICVIKARQEKISFMTILQTKFLIS